MQTLDIKNLLCFLIFFVPICLSKKYTIVVIPDTQYYSSYYEESFFEQTFWACQCSHELNIVFVSQLGDLVNRENRFPHDWSNAGNAIENLMKCNLPHGLLPGNHDVDYGSEDPYHYYIETFPLKNYKQAGNPWFGESFNDIDMRNSYQFFDVLPSPPYTSLLHKNIKANPYIFLHLEYLPSSNQSKEIVEWASTVLNQYKDHTAFLSTHYAGSACSNSVYWLIENLIKKHCNLLFVFSGHVCGCGGERTIKIENSCNGSAFVLVSNYQTRIRGGDAWLRYYTFDDQEDKVCAYTYSPYQIKFELDENSNFSIDLKNMTIG